MTLPSSKTTVAYFSMEIALDKAVPTYSGGLGVLAGDTLRSAADLSLPVVGVTLLHRRGYFEQHLDENGNQTETASEWSPEEMLEPVDARTTVTIEGRTVAIRAWKYPVRGHSGHEVPVYLLDTQLPENSEFDRTLTDTLYGGDSHYRLLQEVRENGAWEAWLEFFLDGVAETANQAFEATSRIVALFKEDRERITIGSERAGSALRVHDLLQQNPFLTANRLVKATGLSTPTVNAALSDMQRLGIVEEVTGRRRGRVFGYRGYLAILNEGTAPLPTAA